jgi:uncharacterized protein YndB with AHSA1/START domain
MTQKLDIQPESDKELAIRRLIDAPPEKVFRAWTDPKLMVEWFAPKPWSVARVENDVRAGGSTLVVMKSPEGQEMPCPGIYLEIIPNKKIVFTDAFTRTWEPSGQPFFVGVLTFEEQNGKTIYTARAKHWTKEARNQHEKMGFHEGWAICADQLEEVVKKL